MNQADRIFRAGNNAEIACVTGFSADNKGLPFPDELVSFARRDREHSEIHSGNALHTKDFKRADGNAVLLSIAEIAVNNGKKGAGFGLALAGESRHRNYDAGRYTQVE